MHPVKSISSPYANPTDARQQNLRGCMATVHQRLIRLLAPVSSLSVFVPVINKHSLQLQQQRGGTHHIRVLFLDDHSLLQPGQRLRGATRQCVLLLISSSTTRVSIPAQTTTAPSSLLTPFLGPLRQLFDRLLRGTALSFPQSDPAPPRPSTCQYQPQDDAPHSSWLVDG